MNSASSLTQPSSAEPRVCCQGRPRKYRPGHLGDAALVLDLPAVVEDGQLDEGVVEPEARRPDDGVDGDVGAVGEGHRGALGAGGARPHLDALLPCAAVGWSR